MQNNPGIPRRQFFGVLGGFALVSASDVQKMAFPTAQAPADYVRNGEVDWRRVREDFWFNEGLSYLNCSAMGAVPKSVFARVVQAWQTLDKNPSDQGYGPLRQAMDDVRGQAARLIGCSQKELLATNSTTDGMNILAQGIGLSASQRVLTTDQEHPGGRECWDYYAQRYGVGSIASLCRFSRGANKKFSTASKSASTPARE